MSGHPTPDRLEELVLGLQGEEPLRAHLDSCEICLALTRRLKRERARITEALSVPAPAGLASRILDGVAARAPRRRSWAGRIPLAAAAALFLSVVGTLLLRSSPGGLALENGTRVTLSPQADAAFPAGNVVSLRRGAGTFRIPAGAETRVVTDLGTINAHGAEFTVGLRVGRKKGEPEMESLLALVVTVLSGNVNVDAVDESTLLRAGESQVFAIQEKDDDEKGKKGKNEKGKKNEKDEVDREDGKKKEKKGEREKGEKENEGKEKSQKKKDKKDDD